MTSPTNHQDAADPMEDFLTREKAALDALESVELESGNPNAMQIDQIENLSPKQTLFPSLRNSPSTSSPPPLNLSLSPRASLSNLPSPVTTVTGTRTETDIMQEWKAERNRRIAERETTSEQTKQTRHNKAQQELEEFKASWKRGVEEKKVESRNSMKEEKKSEWDNEKPTKGKVEKEDINWKSINSLVETLPKPSKDTTRLLGIIRSMQDA